MQQKKHISFYLLLAFLFFSKLGSTQNISEKISLLGHWNKPELPRLNGYQIWNDLTGYYDSISKKEYIIAGSTDSIYFLDVSNPTQIKVCDVADGKAKNVVNRDYECYSHYAYCVSDNGNKGSLQVFDLQYLPDSVHKVYDSDSMSVNTHSIFIDAKSKRLYLAINRLKLGGVVALDIMGLENPEHPIWIGRLEVPTYADGGPLFRNVHEVYVRNDTAYCSVEYQGLWIFDLRDLKKQRLINFIKEYPENGYNHSSMLDATGKNIVFTDEIPGGLAIKLFDISDFNAPKLVSLFRSNPKATAHNAYWIGNFAYVSYYHDGFYIFDLSDKSKPSIAGYYHTSAWPPSSYDGYKGCWGVYPYLPSGNIAVSDMGEGIFMLKVDSSLTGIHRYEVKPEIEIWPNPFNDKIHLNNIPKTIEQAELKLYTSNGELVLHKILYGATFEAETAILKGGMYFALIQAGEFLWVQKILKL